MIDFPKSTEVNKRIPKQKFYDNISITPALKRSFTEQIKSIYWRNKVAPSTTNLEIGQKVVELEFFEIHLNSPHLDEKVLKQIDCQIPYHILFLLEYDEKYQIWIGYKEAAGFGNNAFKVNVYFHTDWCAPDKLALKLEGLNMDSVYENLVCLIGGITVEDGNSVDEQIELNKNRERIEKEIARLEKQARKETQPKKKFELVQKIKELKREGLF